MRVRLRDLLAAIVEAHELRFGSGLPKTKLIKMAYLAELDYARSQNNRLTDADWVYYLFGPYVFDIDNILRDAPFEISEYSTKAGHDSAIITNEKSGYLDDLTFDERQSIAHTVADFSGRDLEDILEHVYFETEPMMNVEERHEKLDFSSVLPSEYYKVKPLTLNKKKSQAIRRAFREKVKAIRER